MKNASWYVAYVGVGQEISACEICNRMISKDLLVECFLPKYETMRKINGEWQRLHQLLFPGYVFLISNSIIELLSKLAKLPIHIRVLGQNNDEDKIIALSEEERDWLLAFTDKVHCIRMSRGYILGDKIIVSHGPLVGREAIIKKIDRHKRRAIVEISMFGRTTTASIGLEIVAKHT